MTTDRPWSKPGVWRNRSRLVRLARLARTARPVTFNDKVRYKLLRDHRQLMVTFADKAAMREHVSGLVGPGQLPRALLLTQDPSELLRAELPETFVLKPTHGSGACVVVDHLAPAQARLPEAAQGWTYAHVRPAYADRVRLAAIAEGWLRARYGRGPNHEWAYGRVTPRLIVEELLRGPDGGIPSDLKLFVFHQHCRFVQVDGARFGSRTQDFFDRDWNPLPLTGGPPRSPSPPPGPPRLQEMLALAQTLSAGTDFVRVDLFCLEDRVVVGELTSSPAGGDSPFHPAEWNRRFGETWVVPRTYDDPPTASP